MAKESPQRQTASYWKIMGLEFLSCMVSLNYSVFGVSFCSSAIKIFAFLVKATDTFTPLVFTCDNSAHLKKVHLRLGYREDGVRAIWTTMGHDARGANLKRLSAPSRERIRSDRRWRISNYSSGSPNMQREQPIKTWRRGLARSYTKTWKEMKKRKEQERGEDVETGVRCKDSQFACTSTPFLSLCTIWIREKSLNPGWLWTTKRSLNYTPNLQLYARTHSHQAHRGCDMRNQILKKK